MNINNFNNEKDFCNYLYKNKDNIPGNTFTFIKEFHPLQEVHTGYWFITNGNRKVMEHYDNSDINTTAEKVVKLIGNNTDFFIFFWDDKVVLTNCHTKNNIIEQQMCKHGFTYEEIPAGDYLKNHLIIHLDEAKIFCTIL